MLFNEIDKFGIIIPRDRYTYNSSMWKFNNPHINIKKKYGNLRLTISSKIIQRHNSFGYISYDDLFKYSEIIYNSTGYNIALDEILNAQLYWLDIKRDIANTTGYSNREVISVLREMLYKNTTKYETPSFDKDKGYENSILLKSTCKTVKDSFTVYDKIAEIIGNRFKEQEYYNNFSKDFLEENTNILRFERRLQSSRDVKKAFHFEGLKKVTLIDIFNSNTDVVAEKVHKIFR